MSSKSSLRTNTVARVRLTIEVSNLGNWGADCPVSQVYQQALVEAENVLRKLFQGNGVRVIGNAVVTAITTDVEVQS